MLRILVIYNNSKSADLELHLIVKAMPVEEGLKKTTLENNKVFDVEVKVYKEVIPVFEKYLKLLNESNSLNCKCFLASMNPQPMLVFEDLGEKGFKRIVRRAGNKDVAMKALDKIAKWHALSFKANADGHQKFKEFSNGFFTKNDWKEIPIFKDGFKFFLEMLKSRQEFEAFVPKFEKYINEDPLTKTQDALKYKNMNWLVLNMGDIHYGNLMFSEKEGSVDDVMLFDYQLTFWGPAVSDLIYVLYMYIDSDERILKRDEIIYKYFKVFTETLRGLNHSGEYPKLTDLHKDFLSFKAFEIMMTTCLLPFGSIDEDFGKIDIGLLMGSDEARKNLYTRAKYLQEIREILPFFLHRGYLE
ncbi:hypothetical protein ACFFRR_009151 [Megaselia abdita]